MAHVIIFLIVANLLITFLSNPIAILAAESTNRSELDMRALLDFKHGISSDPSGVLSSWVVSLDFCRWTGVACGRNLPPRVISLELNSVQLTGPLSESLANLTSIVRLDLANNQFSGGIPDELATLSKLQVLMLASNKLEGNIPVSLGSRNRHLSYVNLAYNTLSGGIPHSLAACPSLTVLNLTSNSLSGPIPASLFNGTSSKLAVVNLRANLFNGSIPEFHGMATLRILNLAANNLSGGIPTSLGNVTSLTQISLATNYLVGSIPESLSNILNLTVLSLGSNNLSGYVPTLIYNISSLGILDLGQNNLTGRIPSAVGTNLEIFYMSGNKFDGLLPASLANASKLQILDLSNNLLAGQLPAEIGNLAVLEMLNLGQNQLVHTIPIEIGYLANLQMLSKGQNYLSGGIPSTVANLTGLILLSLSGNRLSGQVPTWIGEISMLNELNLNNNYLNGSIPASLGNCTQLGMLDLSFNSFSGSIPSELHNPSLSVGLDLSNNHLTGSIPPEIGALVQLVLLDVSNNNFSGQVPSSLGQCISLLSLKMKRNLLSGSIPQSFSQLNAISLIDLSQNKFTGQIPELFGNFKLLTQLDISNNNFTGPIPTTGIFQNTTAVILDGNIGLCRANTTNFASMFSVCPIISTGGTKNNNARLLPIVIPPITIALFSFLCFMVTLIKKREHVSPCYKETMKKVSYGDILKATNWLSPVNKISTSRTGSVYIGRFEFDTDLVAIKVFHVDEYGSLNSFLMECQVLRNTRHRNLMKAVTLCSTVDLENNEFKAIVFDFMANGSLDMWVHPKLHQNCPKRGLSLGQRIRIAADVASALDYMHNQLVPPLIHCDLKPSNVLLDYDMTARVGDFGSAKFISSDLSSSKEFVGVGGTIGYIAPEYGMGYKISTRCDVYSFGVLLLEMLTGMRPTDAMFTNGISLHKMVRSAYPNELCKVLDPYMSQEGDHVFATLTLQSYLMPLVEVALLCSMDLPKDRPVTRDVCAKILEISEAFLESW